MGVIAVLTKELEKILSKYPATGCILFPYYRGMVAKEIQLCNISQKDKVLCVGGGSFPCTALQIARKTGAEVKVIDVDPVAIYNSKKVIKSLNLDNKIKVVQQAGQEVDPASFTIIHIARQACPHEEILNNILEKASNGTKILVRSPQQNLKEIYSLLHRGRYYRKYTYVEKQYSSLMKATLLYIKNLGGKKHEKNSPIYHGDTVSTGHPMAG